jgi:hypothetical protein
MYSPTQGRFVTNDPIGFQAGDVNLYRFVAGQPTNATDPTGLFLTFLKPEVKVVPSQPPMVAPNGYVFWAVNFEVKQPADAVNGGFIIQRLTVKGHDGELVDYWEAFPVDPGKTTPNKTKMRKKEEAIFQTFYKRFDGYYPIKGKALAEYLQTPANDFFWVTGPHKGKITLYWSGEVYYVQNAAKLPPMFAKDKVPQAGGLESVLDREPNGQNNGKDILDWLNKNNATKPVRHDLEVDVTAGGKTTVVVQVPKPPPK